MPSTIGWLDTTAEQQRIAREMVELFMMSESRDELGIGQIRDVFSDWLFPGTSVLQTRARYFVLVPWCYQVAEHRARRNRRKTIDEHAEDVQREMVATMQRDFPDEPGLIGKQVGRELKNLPRDLFWSGLVTFGIRRSEIEIPPEPVSAEGEVSELTSRRPTTWDPDLPQRPPDFPRQVHGGLDMSATEAGWLAERMRTGREETYLTHLLALDPTDLDVPAPWDVATDRSFPELEHARRFSWVMQGASLVYNLLVAQRYAEHTDLTALDGDGLTQRFEDRIATWADSLHPAVDPGGWDLHGLMIDVNARNPRINRRTWAFVRGWVDLLRTHGPHEAAHSPAAQSLIEQRERRKGNKSRLGGNVRVLEAWGGASGDGALTYRWRFIRQLLHDINGGHGTQEHDAHA